MPIVARFIEEQAPDVLCLQEIKCQEHQFPFEAFRALGYEHFAVHGQKGYHGVATVSKTPLREFSRYDWQDNGEARHVGVELPEHQGMIVENVYVPAGGDEPEGGSRRRAVGDVVDEVGEAEAGGIPGGLDDVDRVLEGAVVHADVGGGALEFEQVLGAEDDVGLR